MHVSTEFYKSMGKEELAKPPSTHVLVDVLEWDGEKDAWDVIGDEIQAYVKFQNWLVLCHLDFKDARQELKDNGGCPAKVVSAADEAWALFCHDNNHKKWRTVAQNADNLSHECHSSKKGGIYAKTEERGRYKSGYNKVGMDRYRRYLEFFRSLRKNKEKWEEVCRVSAEEFKTSDYTRAYRQDTPSKKKDGVGATGEELPPEAPTLDDEVFGDYGQDGDADREQEEGGDLPGTGLADGNSSSSGNGEDTDGSDGEEEDD